MGRKLYAFLISSPVQSSKTRIAEQKSSSPQPLATAARNMFSVTELAGTGTLSRRAMSVAKQTSLCIHLAEKCVVKSRFRMNGALKLASPLFAADVIVSGQINSNTTWTASNRYQLQGKVYVVNGATLTIEPGTVVQGRLRSSSYRP